MTKPFQRGSNVRISLHVGPLYINTVDIKQKLSGDAVEVLEKLHTMTQPGSIYATSMVSAILALETKKYAFDYVDTVASSAKTKDLDVYRVKILKRM